MFCFQSVFSKLNIMLAIANFLFRFKDEPTRNITISFSGAMFNQNTVFSLRTLVREETATRRGEVD